MVIQQCLIKLYILLRTHDEMQRKDFIKSGLTYFFKPECTYQKKIAAAQDALQALLTALEKNASPEKPRLIALQDSSLELIIARCFPQAEERNDSSVLIRGG